MNGTDDMAARFPFQGLPAGEVVPSFPPALRGRVRGEAAMGESTGVDSKQRGGNRCERSLP